MVLVKKKINKRSTCVLHLCCGDGWKKEAGCPFCGFSMLVFPSNFILTKKALCMCAEVVSVRGASESPGKAEIAQGNLCQNLVLLRSFRDLSRLLTSELCVHV